MAKTRKQSTRRPPRKTAPGRGTSSHAALDVRVLEQIAAGAPLRQVLETICLGIEELNDGVRASILLLEDGARVRDGAAPSLPAEWTSWIDGREIGPGEGSCGTAAFEKRTVIASDIARDPRWVKYRAAALAFGLRSCWSVPFLGAGGDVLGTFAMYHDRPRTPDATQLGLAEHAGHLAAIAVERHRQSLVMREHERHLALIYDHVTDVLFELSVEAEGYRFMSVNPAFVRVTGVPREAVVGRFVRDVIPEPSRSLAVRKYEEAIRTRETVRWEELTNFPAGTRVGEVTVTPVFDPQGRATHLIGSVRDLTVRRQMENEVRQLQKLEAIGRLSGGIAHDFNNILAVILGVGNMLARDVSDPEHKEQLEEIMEAGRRGATLTRQFLAFARKQVLQPQPLNLSGTVRDLAGMMRRLLRADIVLDLRLAERPPAVMGDQSQIEQVLLNLVVNARDAMPEGGRLIIETAEVVLDERAATPLGVTPGRSIRLAVTDTGTGMDEETQRRIFEPFFTTKEAGKGTGLGLATVYGIVKQSGGAIEVESAVGRGTTFRIFLPCSSAQPERRSDRTRQRDSLGRGLEGLQVLLVEDEAALRSAFSRMLGRLKCRVSIAATGAEALEMVEQGRCTPDLLITDTVIPGVSGIELARRLSARLPMLKVLRMSGYADPEISKAESESSGNFLQKPFTLPELADNIRQTMNG